ncbi:hypothetical protein F4703DRAFT_1831929 [Phycomyces blakesleeanus]
MGLVCPFLLAHTLAFLVGRFALFFWHILWPFLWAGLPFLCLVLFPTLTLACLVGRIGLCSGAYFGLSYGLMWPFCRRPCWASGEPYRLSTRCLEDTT